MKVDCALLCDAATVREGLLHILGGGVTRGARAEYPGPLGLTLAMRILIHPTESGLHDGVVILQAEDGAKVIELSFQFGMNEENLADLLPGEPISVPFALPLANVAVPAAGGYSIEVLIDKQHHGSVPFTMTQMEGAQ